MTNERISDARLAEIADYYDRPANRPTASGWWVAVVSLLRELQERRTHEPKVEFNPDTIPECPRCQVQHWPQCPALKSGGES